MHKLCQSQTAAVLRCNECGFEVTEGVLDLVRKHQPNYEAVILDILTSNKQLRRSVADLSEELKQAQEHALAKGMAHIFRTQQEAIENGKAPWCPGCGLANCWGFCPKCEQEQDKRNLPYFYRDTKEAKAE